MYVQYVRSKALARAFFIVNLVAFAFHNAYECENFIQILLRDTARYQLASGHYIFNGQRRSPDHT